MSFDALVRFFFADNGLSAGLAKANAELGALGRAGPGARVGLRALEGGMRTLAFEAVGMGGAVGRAAGGLLQFSGGQALVLGAVAGIGAIALAYRAATKEAKDLQKANTELHKTWVDLVAAGRPNVALMDRFVEAQKKLGELEDQAASRRARAAQPVLGIATLLRHPGPEELRLSDENVARQRAIVQALLNERSTNAREAATHWADTFISGLKDLGLDQQLAALTAHRSEFEAHGQSAAQAWQRAFMRIITSSAAVLPGSGQGALPLPEVFQGFRAQARAGTVTPAAELERLDAIYQRSRETLRSLITPQERYAQLTAQLQQEYEAGFLTLQERTHAEKQYREALLGSGQASRLAAAQMVSAFGNIVAGLLQGGGGIGGFIQSIGGALSLVKTINPVIGAAVGAGGAIISSLGAPKVSIDSFSASAEAQLKRGIQAGPQNVTVLIVDSDTGRARRVMGVIQDEQNHDAVSRVPGPPGVGG